MNYIETKKIFQNYFTNLLYNRKDINSMSKINEIIQNRFAERIKEPYEYFKGYEIFINNILNNVSGLLWKCIYDQLHKKENSPEYEWQNRFRFYLKGGKSQYNKMVQLSKNLEKLKFAAHDDISKYDISENYSELSFNNIDPYMVYPPNLALVLSSELRKFATDSDFDFTFIIKPDNLEYTSDEIVQILNSCMANAVKEANKIFDKDIMFEFINSINNIKNQEILFTNLTEYLSINQTNERMQKFNSIIKEYIDEHKPLNFRLNAKSPFIFISPKKSIINNSMYLFRIVLDIKTGIKVIDDNPFFSMFAEGIDIGYTIDSSDLWEHSGLEYMERPLYIIDKYEKSKYLYPSANLNYLINDNLVIFYDINPSKPKKRCNNFITLLYLSCIDQNIDFPEHIKISRTIYDLMNTTKECAKLKDFFHVINKDTDFILLKVDSKLKDLSEFEKWCTENSFPFSTISEYSTIKKQHIINHIISVYKTIFNEDIFLNRLYSITKDQCILYLHQFIFYKQIIQSYLNSSQEVIENKFYQLDMNNINENYNNKLNNIDQVSKYIESGLNTMKPVTSIYLYIQQNKELVNTNSFAKLISKFKFIQKD